MCSPLRTQAVRCCPLCRQLSWFVTPSAIWPDTPEAKAATIAAYKAKLASIDCRMFAAGTGTCPHGTSCFYRHAYPDGRLEVRYHPAPYYFFLSRDSCEDGSEQNAEC